LPTFKNPIGSATLELWNGPVEKLQSFVLSGVMIAFTAFLTTYASNKRLALAYGYELDASQELFALGTACVGGSLFGAFPVCGSLSRTGLAGQMGVNTQVCSLVVASIIAVSLLFLSPILYFLPMCSLAAIVITSAANLFDFQTPKEIWYSSKETFSGGLHKDFTVWCIGFLCTVQFGALTGIGVAVTVGLGQVVGEATHPKTATLGLVKELGGAYQSIVDFPSAQTVPGILVFEVRGPLCFCSAEGFHEDLASKLTKEVRGVVLAFGSVEYIDYSALSVLKDVLLHFKHDQILFIIADAKPNVELILKEKLGEGKDPLVKHLQLISIPEAVKLLQDLLFTSKTLSSTFREMTSKRMDTNAMLDIHHTHLS